MTCLKTTMTAVWIAAILSLVPHLVNSQNSSLPSPIQDSSEEPCQVSAIHPFDPFQHKQVYRVGVHAIRGFEAAVKEYEKTFSEYLTQTAGKMFDPPVAFEMVPLTFEGIFTAMDNEDLDFLYANPSIYSCIGVEVGASPVATIVSRLEVRGSTFDLDVFGGVIAARADNDDINSILDLKGKIIGAGGISMLMAAQLQFYEMERAGMSYVNDPEQVVFTGNQFDVVKGVLSGEFDVGFVRTDTIERTELQDEDGNAYLVDPDLFKVVEPKIYILDDGNLFPFLHSTPIYPEWPFAALTGVPKEVTEEVQKALLHIGEFALVGKNYEDCILSHGHSICDDTMSFPSDFLENARCDTTKDVAELAWNASQVGNFAGFRTPMSYFELRSMQQEAGFLLQNEKGDWYCTRPSSVYDGITCPEGHFKRSREEFDQGCERAGMICGEGYDCFCKPCVEAFEVSVYQHIAGEVDYHLEDYFGEQLGGCEKMSICATTEQNIPITIRMYDARHRVGAVVTVLMHFDEPRWLPVTQVEGTFAYDFTFSHNAVGVEVFEVFVDGEQIPESPLRLEVLPHDCGLHGNRVPNSVGICVCPSDTYDMLGTCVMSSFFFVMISAAVFILLAFMLSFYLAYKRKQTDSVWHVDVNELIFDEPPEVVGNGAFGVVILAQYRGTRVAVKRVLPRRRRIPRTSSIHVVEVEKDNKKEDGNKNINKSMTHEDDIESGMHSSRDFNCNSANSVYADSIDELLNHEQKYDSAVKILESATRSATSSGMDPYGSSSYRTKSFLPYWLSWDEHSRLKTEFVTEMRLLSKLRHPCITTVMGAVISQTVDPMLVMEYMEYGSLYDVLHNETVYTGGEIILQIAHDVAQGIRFLHASKPPILHGDLKAKNILVDSRFRAKVADFGLAHFTESNGTKLQGTAYFMAPEYLRHKTEYNAACDMYSIGMIFYEIYARKDPFEGENIRRVLPKICHPRINLRPPVPKRCPPKMAEIMKKLWSVNPFFRPSAQDLDYLLMDMQPQEVEPLANNRTIAAIDENKSKKSAKELLYDVFPKHIADALNAGQKVEPENHECVTVVFSDIVGFTDISATFSPMQVSTMLDRLYQSFDELSRKHHVFKVETIGDAYMGVTNLTGDQTDCHVTNIAEFAMDAVEAASKILIDENNPERGCIKIRVGFHSGPVVSNVIGTLNPRYGLFGDTVNTASRMESNSKPGRILCSQPAATLLKEQSPQIPLRKRDRIRVKGKGDMTTYWVGTSEGSLHERASDAVVVTWEN